VDSVLTVGRYGISEWLASGAMNVVFRGYDSVLDRPVAIKILRRELAKGSAAQGWNERFKVRARAAARLFHPNIVTILDFGEDHDVPYLITEYIEGPSLDRLLKISGPLAPERALAIVQQILLAVKFSHDSGVFHLGLKPSTVLVSAHDQVKVAEFGVTPVDALEPAAIGDVPEGLASLAPEQLARAPVDHRTDVFAAGALLFEMLTCVKPFRGESFADIVAQMEDRGPEDVCLLNPEVPSALRGVIETALAYDPGQRFATASAFWRALSEAASFGDKAETAMRSPSPAAASPGWRSPAADVMWDPQTLLVLEADLARHIGPVAAIAVKRAAKRANDLGALYEALAEHIESSSERDAFLASGRVSAAASDGIASHENSAGETAARASRLENPPDPAVLDAIEAELAQYVGPIAKFLLRQQLQSFENMAKLYRTLAEHISDEAERAAFLNRARAAD
jgi:serine/threonine protein kinase